MSIDVLNNLWVFYFGKTCVYAVLAHIPVCMAQFRNRGASFSTSQPCRAACIHGIWKIFFSYKCGHSKQNTSETLWCGMFGVCVCELMCRCTQQISDAFKVNNHRRASFSYRDTYQEVAVPMISLRVSHFYREKVTGSSCSIGLGYITIWYIDIGINSCHNTLFWDIPSEHSQFCSFGSWP